MRHLSFGFLMISALSVNSDALCAQTSWTAVERTIGRSGVPQAGDVLRFNFPRSDLRVVLDGVQLRPNLVLRSWVSFKRMPDGPASRLTFDTTSEVRPRWTPDGQSVVYVVNGQHVLRQRRADGTGETSTVLDAGKPVLEGQWSRDGRWLIARTGGLPLLAELPHLQPDVALVDLRMPEVGGLDLFRAIREAHPTCHVILMTAHTTVDSAIEAVKLGALDYLGKPFDWDRLHAEGSHQGRAFAFDVPPGTQDTASVQAAMMQNLATGREPQTCRRGCRRLRPQRATSRSKIRRRTGSTTPISTKCSRPKGSQR